MIRTDLSLTIDNINKFRIFSDRYSHMVPH